MATSNQPAAYIDQHATDLIALLRDLVRIDTTNPPGTNYDAITVRLQDELQQAGLRARRLRPPARFIRAVLPPEERAYTRFNVLCLRSVR